MLYYLLHPLIAIIALHILISCYQQPLQDFLQLVTVGSIFINLVAMK